MNASTTEEEPIASGDIGCKLTYFAKNIPKFENYFLAIADDSYAHLFLYLKKHKH
jgi:hypothetical protein